jgi:thioredoxin-like negative regulator of GroEL
MAIQHVFLLVLASALADIYEKTSSDLFLLNSQNYDKLITKKREKHVSIVHFYRQKDGKSSSWANEIKELASEWQGVYNIGVVDCDKNEALCESQDIRATPVIKVVPPFPAPIQQYEGEVTSKALNAYCSKFVKSLVVEITDENFQTFLTEKPSMPKVFLFTEKSGTPTLFKALSNTFESKMLFSIVRPKDKNAVAKFKVKSYPKIILYKTSDSKTVEFNGELKFKSIFDWLNVYSETFVSGGTEEILSSKPWMNQGVPQLVKQSADDICYKHDGYLCAILFLSSAPDEKVVATLKTLSEKYGMKKDRGADVKFMWVDINADPGYFQSFDGASAGQIAFLKYGKRSRFVLHEGKINVDHISETIDKIAGGDARFVNIKGGLPELSILKK